MKKDISTLCLKELAAYISHYLRENGIPNVLTGGACVSIYTNNRYKSYDLDLVNIDSVSIPRISSILKGIGFQEKGRIYVNSSVKYSIDILTPPLSVGRQKVIDFNTIEIDHMVLKLLSPTDSVKDRLAAFYFWNDRQALEQAIMVRKDNEINLNDVRDWSEVEGELEKFNYFLNKIAKGRKSGRLS